jgi:hypothetical protein
MLCFLVHYLIGTFLWYHGNENCYAVRVSGTQLYTFGTFVLMNAVIYFEMLIGLNFVELHLACWVLSLWDHQLHLSAFNIEIADRINKTIQKLGTYAGLSFFLTKI